MVADEPTPGPSGDDAMSERVRRAVEAEQAGDAGQGGDFATLGGQRRLRAGEEHLDTSDRDEAKRLTFLVGGVVLGVLVIGAILLVLLGGGDGGGDSQVLEQLDDGNAPTVEVGDTSTSVTFPETTTTIATTSTAPTTTVPPTTDPAGGDGGDTGNPLDQLPGAVPTGGGGGSTGGGGGSSGGGGGGGGGTPAGPAVLAVAYTGQPGTMAFPWNGTANVSIRNTGQSTGYFGVSVTANLSVNGGSQFTGEVAPGSVVIIPIASNIGPPATPVPGEVAVSLEPGGVQIIPVEIRP